MTVPSITVLQADVVFVPDKPNRSPEERSFPIEIEAEVYPDEPQLPRHPGNSDRPLFFVLYLMLALATSGLAFSITRYVQVQNNGHMLQGLYPPKTNEDQSSSATAILPQKATPVPQAEADPNRDPTAYRSDIEYILSAEIDGGCSKNFLEGAQKRAIDWLVYQDMVLTSSKVKAMVESIDNGDGSPSFPLVQRYALMVLFFQTNGELWSDKSWTNMVDIHECKFMGIDCDDSEGQVNYLDLAFRKLRGRLPDEIGLLTNLLVLNLKNNYLEGTIPSVIYNKLTNLRLLGLSANEISSTISPDISKLTDLRELHLSDLSLTGEIPADAMKSLSNLEDISFSYASKMSGPLLEFSEHWPNLKHFNIYNSFFTGTIPTTIGMNTGLETLWLRDSAMNITTIPTEIGLLNRLEMFLVDYSREEEREFATVPTELGNCQALEYLHISGSGPTGSIPTELGRLTNLRNLRLVEGQLGGSVPSEIGRLTKLLELGLYQNRLEGSLPSSLVNIKGLQFLELHRNNLTGIIPSGVCENNFLLRITVDCAMKRCECCDKCI